MSRKPIRSILLLLLLASPLWVLAQAEVEPNNTRATANRIAEKATVTGTVACSTNPTDPDDYFVSTLPKDGTVRVYVEYTNASGSAGSDVTLYAYDEVGNQIGFTGTPNVPLGAPKLDTMTVYCRAISDLSFRVNANGCFNYKLRYEVLPPPYAADAEPNGTRPLAKPIAPNTFLEGRVGYVNGQNVRDVDDYFVTTLPEDGTVRATIEYLNTSNDAGSDAALYVYDEVGNQIGLEGTPNVALGGPVTATLDVFCRAKSQLYFRVNANGCFGYKLKYEMLVPPYAADAEPNGSRELAKPIAHNTFLEGRVGYVNGQNQRDVDDYFVTTLPDDGTVRATIEYFNTSNDAGSDAALYVYDEVGNQIGLLGTPNVALGAPVTVSTDVFCRAKSQLYFRVNANGCFGYKLKYEVLVPPYAADAEPNNTRLAAKPIVANTALTGRIAYVNGQNQSDGDDYFVTLLPDDGTVRAYVEYLNTSNSAGSDVSLYAYDRVGNQIGFTSTPNVPLGAAEARHNDFLLPR